jgi:hypothetical protein
MSAVTTVAAMKKLLVRSDRCNAAFIDSAGEVMHRNGSQNSIIHATLTIEIHTSEGRNGRNPKFCIYTLCTK